MHTAAAADNQKSHAFNTICPAPSLDSTSKITPGSVTHATTSGAAGSLGQRDISLRESASSEFIPQFQSFISFKVPDLWSAVQNVNAFHDLKDISGMDS